MLNHPAITAAIIGPRTMEQLESQLAAADVASTSVLDRIDEIVPPGTTVNPVDNSFDNPALEPAAGAAPRDTQRPHSPRRRPETDQPGGTPWQRPDRLMRP